MFGIKKGITKGFRRTTSDVSKVTIFSLIGLAAGVVLGLMTAKKPGEELRKEAGEKVNESFDSMKKNMTNVRGKLEEVKSNCLNIVKNSMTKKDKEDLAVDKKLQAAKS